MLGVRLNTVHNLWYYGSLMKEIRQAIRENQFEIFRKEFYRRRQDDLNETLLQEMPT
jgi:queuine tRNA-ribosyltransferase